MAFEMCNLVTFFTVFGFKMHVSMATLFRAYFPSYEATIDIDITSMSTMSTV